jgi:hypothetical protein
MPGFGHGFGFNQFGPAHLRGFNPATLFANGEKGALLLPENSGVAVGAAVSSVTDTSGNGKHATQASASKRPILRRDDVTGALYWEFDGVDDCLQCAALGLTGVDAVSIYTAAHKLSDAATAAIAELTNNSSNFSLFGPSNNGVANYGFRVRGTGAGAVNAMTGYPAPHSAVITAYGDISTDTNIIRVNGVAAANNATDQGAGNFGNFGLWIGMRDGTSLPFGGRCYGIIVRGAPPAGADNSNCEAFFNARLPAF